MALTREQKEKILNDYVEKFAKSQALILTDYRGMKVADLARIRTQLRESGNAFMVVKNTLAQIALARAGRPVPTELLAGPVAIGLCFTDIASVSKVLNSVAQETKVLTIKGAILGNTVIDAEQAQALASMPSREVLLSQVIGTLQSPIAGLLNVLAGPMRGLITVLRARAEQLAPAN